jgi:hypothetical protein
MMLMVIPVSVLVAAGLLFAWTRVGIREFGGVVTFGTLLVLLFAVVGLMLLHELLHAVALPRGGSTAATTLGFWPKVMSAYVSYEGELARNRSILVALMPFLVLSVVPLVAGFLLSSAPPWAIALSVLNGLGASADIVGAALIASQVPSSGFVRNRGYETWWRSPRMEGASTCHAEAGAQ